MNWQNVVKLLPTVIGAVNTVEAIASGRKSKDKQNAAVDTIKSMVSAQDINFDMALFLNPEFQTLLRNLIDSVVAMLNFLATQNK